MNFVSSVTAEFASLQDEESGRTLGVLMSWGKKRVSVKATKIYFEVFNTYTDTMAQHAYIYHVHDDTGRSLHCLLCLLYYNVVYLCRGFVTTELISL